MAISDLKKMKVQELRALARKVLGSGASRLRTKGDLVRALEEAEGRVAAATTDVVRAAKDVAKAAGEKGRSAARAARSAAEAAVEGARQAVRSAGARRPGKAEAPAPPAAKRPPAAEPDPEGYFVARVRGEDAAREAPHPMVEQDRPPRQAGRGRERAARDEGLGDLPAGYGDDAFVAIPRDPRTLFLYWDHSRETIADAFGGLESPRAQLWIFARAGGGWERVRTIDLAIEAHGYYVHELEPGRSYRAEIHALDRRGRDRVVARPSNEAVLPPVGPSAVVDDRFARIPWDIALGQALGPGRPGAPFSEEARAILARLSDWTRFTGATWGGGSAGGMGGRPSSPVSAASSPSRGAAGAGGPSGPEKR